MFFLSIDKLPEKVYNTVDPRGGNMKKLIITLAFLLGITNISSAQNVYGKLMTAVYTNPDNVTCGPTVKPKVRLLRQESVVVEVYPNNTFQYRFFVWQQPVRVNSYVPASYYYQRYYYIR